MEKYKPCLRSTNVTCPGALERSCSRALFLIVGIANTASVQYTYDKGNLSTVQRTNNGKSQTYDFTHDDFGNMLTAKVGSRTLTTNVYNNSFDQLVQQTYGNGAVVSYTYDKLGRTKTATYDDGRVLTYVYNGEGRLHSLTETNGSSVTTYLYTYDSIGRLIYSEQKEGYSSVLRTRQGYNEKNQLTSQNWQMNGAAYSEGYTYNSEDGSLNTMTTGVGTTLTMGYDGLRRLTSVTGGPVTRQYTYRDIDSTKTTMQVASVTSGGQQYGYTYDSMGNIVTFSAPGKSTVTYTYDNQGQLLKAAGDTTYTYTYDGAGNILTASDGTATHSYTYGDTDWKDLLTAFDGQAITYDAIGNPTSYFNGTHWNFTWVNGRSLATASDGTSSLSFAYDANGLRTSKTVNGVSYRYYYASGRLMRMTWGTNTIDFFYDANGTPYAMKYNGAVYYYVTNLQGDVMRIVDASGTVVASYDYDPYGKVISAVGSLANINPLRYRGYVYDQETGFYYLQSRYYDPAIGRFINADSYASTGQGIIGHNMFAYCGNSPANFSDETGHVAIGQEVLNTGLLLLLASLDGPLPFVDFMISAYLTATFLHEVTAGREKEEVKSEAITVNPDRKQAYFTESPYAFVPRGLIMVEYPGTYNGRIIVWKDPISSITIFEWDEDFQYGSHYHILLPGSGKHSGDHIPADTPVPEPWNTIYFGG